MVALSAAVQGRARVLYARATRPPRDRRDPIASILNSARSRPVATGADPPVADHSRVCLELVTATEASG